MEDFLASAEQGLAGVMMKFRQLQMGAVTDLGLDENLRGGSCYLLCERNFPVACPEPSQPGIGHLRQDLIVQEQHKIYQKEDNTYAYISNAK